MATDDKLNMCNSKGTLMSVCDQHETPKIQKKCKHYEKASRENRCMYLVFGEYCDCLEAQLDSKSFSKDKITKFLEENQKKIEEAKAAEAAESEVENTKKI